MNTTPLKALRYRPLPLPTTLKQTGALVLAALIFAIDSLSALDIAVAVLYVVVILVAVDIFSRRGIRYIVGACIGLTLVAYLAAHGFERNDEAFGRCLVSLVAVGIAALLALKNKAAKDLLQEQILLLNRSEAFLSGAQRLSLTGSIGFDRANAGMYWSDEARRIFEFEGPARPTMAQMLERTHPDDQEHLQSAVNGACSAQVEAEFRLTMPDGRGKTIRMLAHQVAHPGSHCEFVVALMDITATKLAEEALHRSQSDLAHITRVTTLGELAASIAHEVNQPLAAVIANGEAGLRWLNRDVPDTEEVRSAIERIVAQAHRASEVVRRVRSLSRKTDPTNEQLTLSEVFEESVALVQREIRRHQVNLTLQLDDALPLVCGDRIQLQQVIINLVMNAIQSVAGLTSEARDVHIALQRSDTNNLVVQVRDSGPGIAEQHLPNLFDPFFTTKPKGMGMGLSICRSIIEAHGGRIWADSRPGEGATLSFSLPRSETTGP